MTTHWIMPDGSPQELSEAELLARKLGTEPAIGTLLLRRGLRTPQEVKNFFYPSLEDLHDPFLMKDMDKAVARLNKALGKKEAILIFGDYDVDGTTAVALVYKYLRATGCSEKLLYYYIPDRYDEGYGISKQSIDYAHDRGVKLIIALDCGIKAIEEVTYAQTLGIDFIICDHHATASQLPPAVAVLDAKRSDNTYPNTELCGCGVGFKFMQAFALSNNFLPGKLFKLLDLLAVSIASDLVSVKGENRILAMHGLRQINQNPGTGLKEIIRSCGLSEQRINMADIVFKIGPRINASGRMMQGRETVALLLSKTGEAAAQRTENINSYNNQRREIDRSVTHEALSLLKEQPQLAREKIIVLYQPDWHKGVIGIVASRITEKYDRPAIILSGTGDRISGSARGAGKLDVYQAIEECQDLLQNFGGHPNAAGLTLKRGMLAAFRERIKLYAERNPRAQSVEYRLLNIEATLTLPELNGNLFKGLSAIAPYGPDNPLPLFLIKNLYDTGKSKAVGHNNEHLHLEVTDAPRKNSFSNIIGFNLAPLLGVVKSNRPFDIVVEIVENSYNGKTSMQLRLKDLRPSDAPNPPLPPELPSQQGDD